ncbi:carboxypeptidase-like regulatory domain-containing protein [Haladaptatus sp. DYF46]|uniref:carboxypeptidase-like regulatory domain-containing protein n=1 Tax=Haladaptatus sp. DYF46 TaxID=2886041 RepID=UPI001E624E3C|nr:carboxypeptidase-like regulatory domain-containing protein [Haladaptatus sp. DYF46]
MSRSIAALGLFALLLVATVLPAQAAVSATDAAQFTSTPERVGTVPLARNNTTVHHEDPDDARSEKDMSKLERWLAGRLSSRLGGSTLNIEQGQYDKAQSVLGNDYNDMLDKYVDVAGETEGTDDDRTAKNLRKTKETQRHYVSRVQRYQTLYDRYQTAKRNGNDAKARKLARRLERLQKDINGTSGNLTSHYDRLSNGTNIDTSNETRQIRNVTRSISAKQAEVRESEFVTTNLTATVNSTNVSFLDPLRVSGRLTGENGTGLGNRSIVLRLSENRSVRVRTAANGTFSLVGRPAVVAVGNRSFRVAYDPANLSAYLGSNTTVQATVSKTTSSIRISNHTNRTRYNDTVSVSGRVTTGWVNVSDVPLAVYVGRTRVGTTHTGPSGSYSFSTPLPVDVPTRAKKVRVSLPFENGALTASNATAPLTVGHTATNLTLSGTPGEGRSVDLSGRLETADGAAVAGQRVRIFTNGTQVASTRTNENGTYRVSLVLPPSLVSAEGKTTFVARFDGRMKSVESARTSKRFAVSTPESGPLDSTTRAWLVSLGVATLLTLGGFFLWRSDIGGGDDADERDDVNEHAPDGDSVPVADDSTPDAVVSARTFLDRARSARDAGEFETAVEMGYAATRNRFSGAIPSAASTHWEFYNACREAGLGDETVSTIGDVTERYERAAFAANRVSRETATAVIDAASSLVGEEGVTE